MIRRSVVRRLLGLLLVAVSGLAVWQSYSTTARQAEFVECQARVNDALIASLAQSRETAAQERTATDAVYRAIRENPRAYEQTIDDYFRQRAEADAQRVGNPLPEPPTRRC
jgi:hypothetical protein